MQNPVKSAGLMSELVTNVRVAWRLLRDPRMPKLTKFIIPGWRLPICCCPSTFCRTSCLGSANLTIWR